MRFQYCRVEPPDKALSRGSSPSTAVCLADENPTEQNGFWLGLVERTRSARMAQAKGGSDLFDTPATTNPIDQLKVIGQPADRVDGPRKVSGKAPYAYERHDMVPDPAYGVILGSAIAKGRIISIDSRDAESAPGVLAIVTADNAGKLGKASNHTAHMLAGPRSEEHTSELQSLMRISYAVF